MQHSISLEPLMNPLKTHDGIFNNKRIIIVVVIIIMALQPFIGPWPLFQFLDPIHSR
jgi:hypothetical protein